MLIELTEIDKSYRDRQGQPVSVLKQLSLQVEQGAFVALSGASGCGKSTLLNILGCLDRFDGGEYRFDGENVGAWSEGQRADLRNRRIGFVFQAFHLLPFLAVEANIALPFMYNHHGQRPSHEHIESLLKSVDLEGMSQRYPGELSGGQMQRVAIARALVLGADLILADEPTGNLDSAVAQGVLDLFELLVQQGKTIVMVTHDPAISARADRQIKMEGGQIDSDNRRESVGRAK
ncbi:MAG: ABC transporter ATP-binding protein [Planctomycetota bacterium]|nr:ABC transporter ATP-binding protein [Planctomycetota bacterium]